MTLYYIYFAIIILGNLVGIVSFKKLNNGSKLMLVLLNLTLLSELISTYIRFTSENNTLVYHIFMPIEFILITFSFFTELKYKWMKFVLTLFIFFSIYNSLFIQSYRDTFCSYTFIVQCIITTFWGLLYLRKLLDVKVSVSFTSYPLFWISIGYLIFNIINLFILGTHNTLAAKFPNINAIFGNIRFLSNYLLYISFIFAFLSKQVSLEHMKNE